MSQAEDDRREDDVPTPVAPPPADVSPSATGLVAGDASEPRAVEPTTDHGGTRPS